MDNTAADETSHTTQYQVALLKYVEKEYCSNQWQMSVIKPKNVQGSNHLFSAKPSGFGQSSCLPYNLCSDDEEYLMPKSITETTPGWHDHSSPILVAAWPDLNSLPEAPKNWGQVNQNLNYYHANPMESSSTFWLPYITNWWCQQEGTHWKYAGLSNLACGKFSLIPHGVRVETSASLARDVIGWRQSKTTRVTLWEKVVVRQSGWANNGILAGDYTTLDTTQTENDKGLKREAEQRKFHRLAKVEDFLERWLGSQYLGATQKESRSQLKQMTALGYISDTEEIITASWWTFQHDGAAAFELSEWSQLPPALSAKDLPRGQSQVSNVRRITRINHHPAESDEDSAPQSMSDTDKCHDWNADFDNCNATDADQEADNQSNIKYNNGIDAPASPKHWDVSATRMVPRFIRPTWRLMLQAENGLMTVTTIERRRNKWNKK